MKTEQFTTTVITASEGYCLTQAADLEMAERVIVKKVALGRHDSPDNWKEIPRAEGEAILAAKREAEQEADRQNNTGGFTDEKEEK